MVNDMKRTDLFFIDGSVYKVVYSDMFYEPKRCNLGYAARVYVRNHRKRFMRWDYLETVILHECGVESWHGDMTKVVQTWHEQIRRGVLAHSDVDRFFLKKYSNWVL